MKPLHIFMTLSALIMAAHCVDILQQDYYRYLINDAGAEQRPSSTCQEQGYFVNEFVVAPLSKNTTSLVSDHYHRVKNYCQAPQPRVIRLEDLVTRVEPGRLYTPHVTVLHRCEPCCRVGDVAVSVRRCVDLHFAVSSPVMDKPQSHTVRTYNETACSCEKQTPYATATASDVDVTSGAPSTTEGYVD